MSSEIYELMKRSDEAAVVEKAHRRPRFVEDCVREMVRMASSSASTSSADEHFVSARQENLETIHQHNVRGRALRACSASCAREIADRRAGGLAPRCTMS